MKIFLDTADIEEIRIAARWGVLDGVTTNPTLYAKVGGSYDDILREICDLTPGPVSAEVVAEDVEGMLARGPRLRQARAEHRRQGAHERRGPGGHRALRRRGHQDQLHAHLHGQPGAARGQGRCVTAVAVRRPARRHQPGRHGRHPRARADHRHVRPRRRGAGRIGPSPAPRDGLGAASALTSRQCRSRSCSRWSTTR